MYIRHHDNCQLLGSQITGWKCTYVGTYVVKTMLNHEQDYSVSSIIPKLNDISDVQIF